MEYLVTAREMKRYDANTIEKIGIPPMVLMEHGAMAVERCIRERDWGHPGGPGPGERARVLIVAGTGNNGADGLALARLLTQEGEGGSCQVDVWCVGDASRATEQWRAQRRILEHYPVRLLEADPGGEYDLVVDALFGVGLTREISGIWAEAVGRINRRGGIKIAIDMPSGIDSDTGRVLGCAVKADRTVTFGFCKRGLRLRPGCGYAGEISVCPIGITPLSFFGEEPGMFCLEEPGEKLLPGRDPWGNKGTFGKVLLVAGSRNMAGAAVLAGRAAYRTGCGMVKLISPEENRVILQEALPEALYGTAGQLQESLAWADVIALGPGLGQDDKAKECLEAVVEEGEKPLLIDADGLNLLAADGGLCQKLALQRGREVVLTPHVGELARLLHSTVPEIQEGLWEQGRSLAQELHAVVVAKDAQTFVCRGEGPLCMNGKGNSAMATAGSGDVLAGIIASLLAQGMPAFEAACAGVRIHALAGEKASRIRGEHACMAGDIIGGLAFP